MSLHPKVEQQLDIDDVAGLYLSKHIAAVDFLTTKPTHKISPHRQFDAETTFLPGNSLRHLIASFVGYPFLSGDIQYPTSWIGEMVKYKT